MYEIALSTTCGKAFVDRNPNLINEDFFKDCAQSGIKNIELVLGSVDNCFTADVDKIKELTDAYGIKMWSFHVPHNPFGLIDISYPAKGAKKIGLDIMSELIKKMGDLGIDKYVVHSSAVFRNENTTEEEVKERLSNAKENLCTLASVASSAGGVIAVENLPPTCCPTNYEEHLDLLSADSRLRACFDTNHKIGGSPAEHIRALGSKLITLHVSDYELAAEKHWLPGEGKNNWNEIVDALHDINYQGMWLYELAFDNPPAQNRQRRNLTCEDIVRNAKEVMSKQKITVIE